VTQVPSFLETVRLDQHNLAEVIFWELLFSVFTKGKQSEHLERSTSLVHSLLENAENDADKLLAVLELLQLLSNFRKTNHGRTLLADRKSSFVEALLQFQNKVNKIHSLQEEEDNSQGNLKEKTRTRIPAIKQLLKEILQGGKGD